MTKDAKNMLRDSVIPMLLGDSFAAHWLAFKVYFSCGVVSYVCDSKKSLLSLINPAVRFFPLFVSDSCDSAVFSLSYAADNTDYLPILVPCSDRFSAFVDSYRDHLEARFIVSDRSSLLSSIPMSELL